MIQKSRDNKKFRLSVSPLFSLPLQMQLLNLPYELIVQIASNLDPRDIKSFTTVNSRLYQCSLKESLWYDLVRLNNIHYIHPDITYKALYLSGEIPQMCYHIKNLHISDQKIERLWSYINQHYNPKKPEVFCLHSSCKFIGAYTVSIALSCQLTCSRHH